MADLKISQLTAITTLTPATDVLPVVDVTGTTKKITTNQILGSGGTATLASATITGAATVGTTLGVTGQSTLTGNVGVGVAPNAGWQSSWKALDIGANGGISNGFGQTDIASNVYRINTGAQRYKVGGLAATSYTQVSGTHTFLTAGVGANAGDPIGFNTVMTLDAAGNCGIGVTPSAWSSSFKAIQFAANGSLAGQGTNTIVLSSNSFINSGSVYKYLVSSRAANYAQAAGSHIWSYDSGTQTAGADVNFVAAMTLDASGNLILLSSNTPATLTTNGQLTVNATSNTNLRFSYRGSDGVTRVANITLA